MTTPTIRHTRLDALRTVPAETGALLVRRLQLLRRAPGKLLGIGLMPVTMLVVLGYLFGQFIRLPGAGSYLDYMLPGVLAQVGFTAASSTAIGIADDLRSGIFDRFRTMPVSSGSVLVAHALADLLLGAVAVALAAVVATLLGWRTHTGPLMTAAGFVLLLLFCFVVLWIGTYIGLRIANLETVGSVSALLLVGGSFLSSAFVPSPGFPGVIQTIVDWNPISAVVTAVRGLWGAPDPGSGFAHQYPLLIALPSLLLVLGLVLYACLRCYRTTMR